ncbi:hypothetical protein ACXM0N_20375 [Peribacillus simplex]
MTKDQIRSIIRNEMVTNPNETSATVVYRCSLLFIGQRLVLNFFTISKL